jgi:hypothetical protein
MLFWPSDTPELMLVLLVRQQLGYAVTLEPDRFIIRGNRRFARWHTEPLYWARR